MAVTASSEVAFDRSRLSVIAVLLVAFALCWANDGYALRVYRTNGGASTGYGAVVRQERALLPGIVLVRKLYDCYPAKDTRIEELRPNEFVFDGSLDTARALKSWVWF